MQKQHESAAEDEKILEPMLKRHDEDQAIRRALSSAMTSEIGDVGKGSEMSGGNDGEEARIRKAFPQFSAIVAPPPGDP